MKTKKTIDMPKLRFPVFKHNEDWQEISLNSICHFVRGPFDGLLKKDIFVEDGYAVYEQSHAIHGNFDSFRYYITQEKFDELKKFEVKENDLIMSCSGKIGKFGIIPVNAKKGVINQDLLKLTVKPKYNTSFIKIALELPLNQSRLLSQSAGGTVKNVVGLKLIKEINIGIPQFQEQQKIADCLSSLDNLINAETQQLDTLKTHKAGLIQKLFPAEDETIPKFRFEEFKKDKDWSVKKLGDVCKFQQGIQVAIDLQSRIPKKDYIRFIRIENYTQQSQDVRYVSKELARDKYISEDEVAIVRYGATAGFIGRGIRGVLANNLFKVTPRESFIDLDYLYIFLKSTTVYEFFQSEMTGAAMPALSFGVVGALNIPIPKLEEQRKVVKFLFSLDTLISSQAEKIEMLKQHKQGLMQQVFPVLDEDAL